MSSLILKKGKFYKDGVEVPVEIGNAEQIALYKRSLKENSYDIDNCEHIDYDYTIYYDYRIKCECGKYLYRGGSLNSIFTTFFSDVDYYIQKDILDTMENKHISCDSCKRKYKIYEDKDGDLISDEVNNDCGNLKAVITDYKIEYDYYFKCPHCGKRIKHTDIEIDSFYTKNTPEIDIENDILRNEYDYCPHCREEYKLIEDEWGTILAVKELEHNGEDISIVDVILGDKKIE